MWGGEGGKGEGRGWRVTTWACCCVASRGRTCRGDRWVCVGVWWGEGEDVQRGQVGVWGGGDGGECGF